MGKRLVILDWNGCLLDDVPHRFLHGPCAIFKHFGLQAPTIEDYCQHITSDFMSYYYDRGVQNSGDKKRDGDMLNAIMTANMARAPIPPLFPETKEFLQTLADHGMLRMLVSSMEEREFRRQLEHHKLEAFFYEIRGGVRGKVSIFRALLAKYGVSAELTIGVTDTMSDVRELAEVGIKPIIIPRGYSVPNATEVPQLVIVENLTEALKIILK